MRQPREPEAVTAFAARPATVADIDELIRLRGVMFSSMDIDPRPEVWADAATRMLTAGLADGSAYVSVVDHPDRPGLVASGVATIERRLPSPNNPSGWHGYIASIATDEPFRRQGLARRIMVDLLDWLAAQGVTSTSLHATPLGAPLYRQLGFAEPRSIELRRRG